MYKLVLLVCILPIIISNKSNREEMIKSCKLGLNHDKCKPWRRCGYPIFNRGLDKSQEKKIVETVNSIREKFASGYGGNGYYEAAENMRYLAYDTELANRAQTLADRCQSDDSDKGAIYFIDVSGSSDLAPSFLSIDADNVHGLNVTNYNDMYNTLSAVIWAETSRIGCGQLIQGAEKSTFQIYFLVCILRPAGLKRGDPVYIKGKTCDQCSPPTKCGVHNDFPHLCDSPKKITTTTKKTTTTTTVPTTTKGTTSTTIVVSTVKESTTIIIPESTADTSTINHLPTQDKPIINPTTTDDNPTEYTDIIVYPDTTRVLPTRTSSKGDEDCDDLYYDSSVAFSYSLVLLEICFLSFYI